MMMIEGRQSEVPVSWMHDPVFIKKTLIIFGATLDGLFVKFLKYIMFPTGKEPLLNLCDIEKQGCYSSASSAV